jgi:hypothetical protein
MVGFEGQVLQKDQTREAKKFKMLLAEKEEENQKLRQQLADLMEMIDKELPKKK